MPKRMTVKQRVVSAHEKAMAFKQFTVELNPDTATPEELFASLRGHPLHCDMNSEREFAINYKVSHLNVDRETEDALLDMMSREESFEMSCIWESNRENFESEFPGYTFHRGGRSGGYLVLSEKPSHKVLSALTFFVDLDQTLQQAETEDEKEEALQSLRSFVKVLIGLGTYANYIVQECIFFALTHTEVERVVKVKRKFYVCISCEDRGTVNGCDTCGAMRDE